MKAGRELDALVAEKVMGHTVREGGEDFIEANPRITPWGDGRLLRYSTDIAAAWEVVEKMVSEGWEVEIHPHARVVCMATTESAETIPLAICLAALKAVGVEVEVL